MPKEFAKVDARVQARNILMLTAEEELLEYTHAEVGKMLGEAWNLPPKLVDTIAYHHEPPLSERFAQEAAIIHLADILCRALTIGSGGDKKIPPLNGDAFALLQIEVSALEQIMEKVETEYRDIQKFAG